MPQKATFHDQALADLAWFNANPDRSFRIRIVPNAEAQALLTSRDGFGSAVFPPGEAVIVTFWRFTSDTSKAMDQIILPSAPEQVLEAVRATEGSDDFAFDLLVHQPPPMLRAYVHPRDIVFRGETPVLIIDQAA